MASLDGYNVGAPGAPLLGFTMTRLEQLTVLQNAIWVGMWASTIRAPMRIHGNRSSRLAFSRVTNYNLTVAGGQRIGEALPLCRNLKELEYAQQFTRCDACALLTWRRHGCAVLVCPACPGTSSAAPALRPSPKRFRTSFRLSNRWCTPIQQMSFTRCVRG